MKMVKTMLWLSVMLPGSVFAFGWTDLWRTPDQQGLHLLKENKAASAAQTFKDKNWQAVSHYRAGHYEQALQRFNADNTSDGQYNAGNAAAYLGRYQDAIAAYDKAIALNANNQDAIANRELVKKLLQEQQQKNQQQDQQNKQDQQNQQSNKQQQNNENKSADNKNDKQSQDAKQNNQQQQNSQNKQNQQDKQSPQNQPSPANSPQQTADKQQQQSNTTASSSQRRQEEKNNQLLRRLDDEPGGLLQRKFERDYMRRHGIQENNNQGVYQ